MQLSELIAGIIAMIAISIACLGLMSDMYGANHYDVDLASNNYTSGLARINTELLLAKDRTAQSSQDIYSKVVGEENATNDGGTQTQSDVWGSSLLSLTNMGSYLNATFGLFGSVFSILGIAETDVIAWYITTTLLITVALILIGIVFFRPL